MSDWSLLGGVGDMRSVGHVSGSSSGTVVTATVNNTKGAYAELTASTPIACDAFIVSLTQVLANDSLYDIAIGAAGSEQIICNNLYSGAGSGTGETGSVYYIPIPIPIGTRIAARMQVQLAAPESYSVNIQLLKGGNIFPASSGRFTTYGANTADSGGVVVEPGASANTKGAYSQLVASTTNPIRGLIFAIGLAGDGNRSTANWLMDIAVGGAGAETIIIPDWRLRCTFAADTIVPQVSPLLPYNIPVGSRIAARAQCSITTAGDRTFDLIGYGVD